MYAPARKSPLNQEPSDFSEAFRKTGMQTFDFFVIYPVLSLWLRRQIKWLKTCDLLHCSFKNQQEQHVRKAVNLLRCAEMYIGTSQCVCGIPTPAGLYRWITQMNPNCHLFMKCDGKSIHVIWKVDVSQCTVHSVRPFLGRPVHQPVNANIWSKMTGS